MKKILYISNYRKGVGGISAQIDLLCQSIETERVKSGELRAKSDIFSTKGNPIKRIWLFVKLMLVARKYDVLHIHGCSDWGMVPVVYGVIAGKIWRKKIIVTYHGGEAAEYFAKHGAFARRWLKRADKVIVLSGFLEKVYEEYQIPCVVIPNIVKLSEAKEHSEYQWNAPRFISVRHLRELYNIGLIIRAYEIVKQHLVGASLTILGSGPQREELEQYVREHQIKDVTFVGQVANTEINTYLANSDIMLSAPKIDNMPISLLEAMSAGVLVISSRVGGVPYMIENKKNGLLFDLKELENEGVRELAKQMEWVLEHQQECLDMIVAAHDEVKRYSWENIRKQLLPLYE